MAVETPQLTQSEVVAAGRNYVDCLSLPAQSQVLIVTDRLPEGSHSLDKDLEIRRFMADLIQSGLGGTYPVYRVEFDHDTSPESMYEHTRDGLSALDNIGRKSFSDKRTTTVVYIGDAWNDRAGMYGAVNKFAEEKDPGLVRVAGSLGFTTGDARVMSHMGVEQRVRLVNARKYFTQFFQEHPRGRLLVHTRDHEDSTKSVTVFYDVGHAPFESEIGQFDENNQNFNGKFVYVNVPGGESFGTPYPYQQTGGKFVAEGVLFTVKAGMVVNAEVLEKNTVEGMAVPSQKLISLVQGGRGVPVAELGLGYYALAGIDTYPDSSVLSREKGGPHIGVGHGYTSDESEAIAEAAGNFHHTDFVMEDSTRILFEDLNTGRRGVFYPPQAQNL